MSQGVDLELTGVALDQRERPKRLKKAASRKIGRMCRLFLLETKTEKTAVPSFQEGKAKETRIYGGI